MAMWFSSADTVQPFRSALVISVFSRRSDSRRVCSERNSAKFDPASFVPLIATRARNCEEPNRIAPDPVSLQPTALKMVRSGSEVIDFHPSLEIRQSDKLTKEIVRPDAIVRARSSVIVTPRQETVVSDARNSQVVDCPNSAVKSASNRDRLLVQTL